MPGSTDHRDTGLLDWCGSLSGQLLPGVASRPEPILTLDGTRGVISNLRFYHTIHCIHCHTASHLYSDGGTVDAGLEVLRRGKTVRWFEVLRPGRCRLQMPPTCPNPRCAAEDYPFTSSYPISSLPAGPEPGEMLNTIWSTVRAAEPDLAAQADHATTRYEPAPPTQLLAAHRRG